VAVMCRTLGVSRSGYYARLKRPPSAAAARRTELVARIGEVHAEVKGRYGSPRVHAELTARGVACCVNTVAKLMRAGGIRAKTSRRFVRTTDSRHGLPVAENVLGRDFTPPAPDTAWAAEIVYSQMTKPTGLAGRPDWERVADLDVVPRHHNPVDE
jgi:putative transposase